MYDIEEGEASRFDLKGRRRGVLFNLETLLSRNSNTSEEFVPPLSDDTLQQRDSDKVEAGFGAFLQYLNAQQLVFDDTGR